MSSTKQFVLGPNGFQSFEDASAACAQLGRTLPIIDSPEKVAELTEYFNNDPEITIFGAAGTTFINMERDGACNSDTVPCTWYSVKANGERVAVYEGASSSGTAVEGQYTNWASRFPVSLSINSRVVSVFDGLWVNYPGSGPLNPMYTVCETPLVTDTSPGRGTGNPALSKDTTQDGLPVWAIALIAVVAILVLMGIIVVIIYRCCFRHDKEDSTDSISSGDSWEE